MKRLLLILLFVLQASLLLAQTTPYRIRLPDSTYTSILVGVTSGDTVAGAWSTTFKMHEYIVTESDVYKRYDDPGGGTTYSEVTGWGKTTGKFIAGWDVYDFFMNLTNTSNEVLSIGLGDTSVATAKIKDLNVTEAKIGAGAVTETKLGNDAVSSASKIATSAVATAEILNATILQEDVADSQISLAKMTTAAVNYVGSGGVVTNNPDDATLENKSGITIGIKDNWINKIYDTKVVADTTELKAVSDDTTTRVVFLKQLHSGNANGDGFFKMIDSTYTEGIVAFNHTTLGKQWVRTEFLRTGMCDVMWAGAVGDGTTNDSTAFARALQVSNAISLPALTFKTHIILGVNSRIVGTFEGSDAALGTRADLFSKLLCTENSMTIIETSGGNVSIENVYLRGNNLDSEKASIGIHLKRNGTINLENISIEYFKGLTDTCYGILVDSTFNVHARNIRIGESDVGIKVIAGQAVYFLESLVQNCYDYHLELYKTNDFTFSYGNIENSSDVTYADTLIYVKDCVMVSIDNIYSEGNLSVSDGRILVASVSSPILSNINITRWNSIIPGATAPDYCFGLSGAGECYFTVRDSRLEFATAPIQSTLSNAASSVNILNSYTVKTGGYRKMRTVYDYVESEWEVDHVNEVSFSSRLAFLGNGYINDLRTRGLNDTLVNICSVLPVNPTIKPSTGQDTVDVIFPFRKKFDGNGYYGGFYVESLFEVGAYSGNVRHEFKVEGSCIWDNSSTFTYTTLASVNSPMDSVKFLADTDSSYSFRIFMKPASSTNSYIRGLAKFLINSTPDSLEYVVR